MEEGEFIVRMRGLPWTATAEEVAVFLEGKFYFMYANTDHRILAMFCKSKCVSSILTCLFVKMHYQMIEIVDVFISD